MSDTSRLPLARLLLVGVLFPAIFSTLDHWLLSRILLELPSARHMALTMATFVAQVGIMSWLCGRLLTNPLWRWGLYVWSWVLIDLQLFAASSFSGRWTDRGQLPASLFAAQIGLTIVWAVMGDTQWAIRLPVCALLGTALALPMNLGYGYASEVFPIQLVALAILCLLLRWRKFRLVRLGEPEGAGPADATVAPGSPRTQFSIRHVLIWTTSLAVLLGVLRALDRLSLAAWVPLFREGHLAVLTGGILLACAFVVVLWASLGSGSAWVRLPILVVGLAVSGFALGIIHFCSTANPRVSFAELWMYRREFWPYSSWLVVWVALAGSLLFASLLILRAVGYRLVRAAKKPPVLMASPDG